MMAVRISRRGLRNREQNPKSKRSVGRRLGARRRDLCRTRSCCFKRILSARTARVPPVPRRMPSPASRCPSNTIALFIGKQLARYWIWRQGSRIPAEGPLNYEFAMHMLPIASRIRSRLRLEALPPKQLQECLNHLLKVAGNPKLLTPSLIQTLCEHAAGNLRLLMNMANDLLAAACQQEREQIDEKLYFEVFALDPMPAKKP